MEVKREEKEEKKGESQGRKGRKASFSSFLPVEPLGRGRRHPGGELAAAGDVGTGSVDDELVQPGSFEI